MEKGVIANTWNHAHIVGESLGMLATACFTMQYIPQTLKNYQRKSCKGFSSVGIVIKLIGAAFLMVNSFLMDETWSVVLYGLFAVFQHSIFMLQFVVYGHASIYYLWILFPVIPFMMGSWCPGSVHWTTSVKPLAQILSHIPQLQECYKLKSTSGVSLQSQHLNIVGGISGLTRCFLIPPKSEWTYCLYLFAVFQALSLYSCAVYYDNYRFGFWTTKKKSSSEESDVEKQPFLSPSVSKDESKDISL